MGLGLHIHKLQMISYFLIHDWRQSDMEFALYTEHDLRTIHKNFAHLSGHSTEQILKRPKGTDLTTARRKSIEVISRESQICVTHARALRSLKLVVGTDNVRFNHTAQVDTIFIWGRPVIHMVDLVTQFCDAAFPKKQTTPEICRNIRTRFEPRIHRPQTS